MISISVMDLLIAILALAGLVVLVFFALFLQNALKLVKSANELIEKKRTEIDTVIDEIPVLINNANEISMKTSMLVDDLNEIVIKSKDDVTGIVASVNRTMDDVNRVSTIATNLATQVEYTADNAVHSVNALTDNLLDASRFISTNKDNIIDYIYIFRDFIEEMKRIFFGRR